MRKRVIVPGRARTNAPAVLLNPEHVDESRRGARKGNAAWLRTRESSAAAIYRASILAQVVRDEPQSSKVVSAPNSRLDLSGHVRLVSDLYGASANSAAPNL